MIDKLLNLLFRCRHRRLTRPVAPISKAGQPKSQSYVVCLDCGKQFEYDLKEMRMGKAIAPPKAPMPRNEETKFELLAALPTVVVPGELARSR